MAERLQGKRIAFLMANEGVEQVELTEPLRAVREAGAEAELIAPDGDQGLVSSRKPDDLEAFTAKLVGGGRRGRSRGPERRNPCRGLTPVGFEARS